MLQVLLFQTPESMKLSNHLIYTTEGSRVDAHVFRAVFSEGA